MVVVWTTEFIVIGLIYELSNWSEVLNCSAFALPYCKEALDSVNGA